MAENREPARRENQKQGKVGGLKNIFYHNTFVLIFSFSVALITWFIMTSTDTDSNRVVTDVPIQVKLSTAAEEDGLRVFNMSYNSADLEIAGNSLITGKLSPDDFAVSVTLNPTSTKLTGNTLQKMTARVQAAKQSAATDYSIVSVSPEEVTLEYDRYKEVTLPIENDVKYSADTGFATGGVTMSADMLILSGPESAVNKISRAAVSYSFDSPLKTDNSFSCPIRLYDQNNQEIDDTSGMYLEMSADTVDVTISILPKKTVELKAATLNQPKGFSPSRITVVPETIDVAGPQEVLSGLTEITLDTPINFAELDLSQKNSVTCDIPLPPGVRNLSAAGEGGVSQATVSINLNGYKAASVSVPEANIQAMNLPAGMECALNLRSLDVKLVGPEALVSKLTGSSLSVQADLTNFTDRTGTVEVPVTVSISGSGADSCWVLGSYTVSATLTDSAVLTGAAMGRSISSDAVNAAPNE